MIAVEIPAALAERPEVVPVDESTECSKCATSAEWCTFSDPDAECSAGRIFWLDHIVGQRVALAWRETCPTCRGTAHVPTDLARGQFVHCEACGEYGSRMVVGWTAEAAEVLPIVAYPFNVPVAPPFVTVVDHKGRWDFPALHRTVAMTSSIVDGADVDWSPGRYALVLRLDEPLPGRTSEPYPCRPFHGFADLDEVLA